jgi:hypothetical protein
MPKQAKVLGPLAVKNLTTPGLHFVGEVPGLALQVLPTGARTWILRVTIGARRREMGLGGYPEVSLADARTLARQARQRIRDGIDPIEERRAARSALLASAANIMTFKTAAEALIASKEAEWKNPKGRVGVPLERGFPLLSMLGILPLGLLAGAGTSTRSSHSHRS